MEPSGRATLRLEIANGGFTSQKELIALVILTMDRAASMTVYIIRVECQPNDSGREEKSGGKRKSAESGGTKDVANVSSTSPDTVMPLESSAASGSGGDGEDQPPSKVKKVLPADAVDVERDVETYTSLFPSIPVEGLSTRREVVDIIVKQKKEIGDYINIIESRYAVAFPTRYREKIEQSVTNVVHRYNRLLRENNRNENRPNVKRYLDSMFYVDFLDLPRPETLHQHAPKKRGMPPKDFSELASSSKYRKLHEVVQKVQEIQVPPEEALVPLVKSSNLPQKGELEKVIKYCLMTPGRPEKALKRTNAKEEIPMTPEEALGLMLNLGLSVGDYRSLRNNAVQHNSRLYPSYDRVNAVKKMLRPPVESVKVTDLRAHVILQDLADKTCERILAMNDEVLQRILEVSGESFIFICSWGFDGSTNQSNYKQGYADRSNPGPHDDSALFATTMIPLQIVQRSTRHILWQNTVSQSVRFCRPIDLHFTKESKDLVMEKKAFVEQQINNIKPYESTCGNKTVKVDYEFALTVIDGKILNFITGTRSSQNCLLCKATPSMFNNLNNMRNGKFTPEPSALKHGINPMHAYIRMLELFLHIGYKLDIKKWRSSTQYDKDSVERRKRHIQSELFEKLNLRVDFPNPGGAGTSNDGNTARRAFANYTQFADILGVEKELLRRVGIILQSISHDLPIDPDEFQTYCHQVLELYVSHYPWYYMSATLHKILVHGDDIVRNSLLPLGMLSEQAAESKNKYYRSDRLGLTRKMSRQATMTDLFYRSIDFSDPIISTQSLCRTRLSSNRLPLDPDAKLLLICPDPPEVEVEERPVARTLFDTEDMDQSQSSNTGEADQLHPEDYGQDDIMEIILQNEMQIEDSL